MKELTEFLCRLLWFQLQSLGFFATRVLNIPELKLKTGIIDFYDRWLSESLAVLERMNYLIRDGETYSVVEPAPADIDEAWAEWDRRKTIWLEDPNLKTQVILVDKTLRALPRILTGEIPATDIMFPNSSMTLVEGIYKNNAVADAFNEVLADTLVAYIEERLAQDLSAQIRMIEIGAGTGGTSTMVFQKLRPFQAHIQEYCYTDISKAFLLHAEKEYGPQNPYLTYRIFNVELPPTGQKIDRGGYDVAIATNVLHATKNIRETLRNTKALLKKNGLVLLNEICSNNLPTHLTFGLLEGWWLYEDAELRIPGCPGLAPETWQTVLESEGFQSVFFPAQEAQTLGQQIIVAESDGIIRQKRQLKPEIPTGGAINEKTGNRLKVNTSPDTAREPHFDLPKTNAAPESMENRNQVTPQMVESHIRRIIITNISESLKVDVREINDDESFSDYGLDSIMGVHLVQVIGECLGVELKTTDLFDYSSVNLLTQYILTQFQETIAAGLSKNIPLTGVRTPEFVPGKIEPAPEPSGRIPQQRKPFGIDLKKSVEITREITSKDAIAIIGMSGRYAKSETVNELWENLAGGRELIGEVTRWDFSKHGSGKTDYYKYGSFLDDIDQFDPLFFNISGIEATYMDPGQRLFLEESWKALEDAGYAGSLGGSLCGVYVGYCGGDYQQLNMKNPPAQAMWGNVGSIIPARIAYYLNLQGPAITIDTSCSSSLVAIHLACQGLWNKETSLAIAGGVSVHCTPGFFLSASRAGMLSPTGHCYTFDERADGFVPGEGVGVVVLKRLGDAMADGDHIYGVIRGTGINQDGTTNGITAPSANSQERLERYVYDTFHINPEWIQMVEAHGTGTKLGDPIEFKALTQAFRNYTDKRDYCAIGSIKTNLGHTTAAAGVAGVIKVLLSLKHRKIPPSLYFQSGNPLIHFKESPFYVNQQLKDWEVEPDAKRCAAVSSFGFSGTNAHLVIEEAPPSQRIHSPKPGYLIVLSARSFAQLQQQAQQLATYCEQEPRIDCGDMSYTLLLGRKHFNYRLACVIGNPKELADRLRNWLEKGESSHIYVSELSEKAGREQYSLSHYGNQCIKESLNANLAGEYMQHLSTLADLYTQGCELEFERFFAGETYGRISLPTYPFARESYWIPEDQPAAGVHCIPGGASSPVMTAFIHPLLHQNTSDIFEQRFSSSFTGKEPFLAAHIFRGQRILSAAACLEMARAAVTTATGSFIPGDAAERRMTIQFENVVWTQPIELGEGPVQIDTGIYPDNSGKIAYEIYRSQPTDDVTVPNDPEQAIYSQGWVKLVPATGTPALELKKIQEECNSGFLSSTEVYENLNTFEISYDQELRGIDSICLGPGQVLAKLYLPEVMKADDEFLLQPLILDSAFQASALLINSENLKVILPYSLKKLEILDKCPSPAWAWIRYANGRNPENNLLTFDIDLCDEQGMVCIRMMEYGVRSLAGERTFITAPQVQPQPEKASESQVNPEILKEKTVLQLKTLFGEVTRLAVARLDTNEPLESYGIDSIMITELNQKLAGIFGELSQTLFYEYLTLGAIAGYLAAEHPQACIQWTGLAEQIRAVTAVRTKSSPSDELPAVTSFKASRGQVRSLITSSSGYPTREPIAIIGMSGRYPQAGNLKEYWNHLKAGKELIREIPEERWPLEGFYHPDPSQAVIQGKSYSKWGGFIEGFADFDPLFFNILPREAFNMDPQERLFIETCWEVLEDAGYTREQLAGHYHNRVGVFTGITKTGFDLYGPHLWEQGESMFPHTSFGSVANRISYLLNLQGPSMPVDTMCSSSLTAIHEACEHLLRDECVMAIAGGVNLYLHPASYIALCGQQMLSTDGKCRSFGRGGNGFTPGEGVGAVLLKRLSQATQDQDHIYAVIRSTSINHGGKTNGYTVPNPVAQGELIRAALDKAGINARTVSYVEAHGTGTELGDPIEITGLTQAFRKDTGDTEFCAIGSVKSNIGHLEAAAGIAGLTKIVLQMNHQTMVPSLHAGELNPNINFGKSPFTVQQTLAEWKRPVVAIGGETREYPRIAGISSFGAGGANAHIIVEEYISQSRERIPAPTDDAPQECVIIILSARNEERLKERARQLSLAIRKQDFSHDKLVNMAYTLQVGREAMEDRLGFIVGSTDELAEKLWDFAEGRDGVIGIYRGQVKRNQEALAVLAADEDMAKTVEAWIAKGKYEKLLELWVKGLVFDWNKLYGETKPQRISLPTYPFAKERYWVPESYWESKINPQSNQGNQLGWIHPMLHENGSDFFEQRFRSNFTGREFFMASHIIQDRRVFPGMACLEMTRAAMEYAVGNLNEGQSDIRFQQVKWSQPIAVGDQPVQMNIGLYPQENAQIAYEIYTLPAIYDGIEAGTENAVVYNQGTLGFIPTGDIPTLDLPGIRALCGQSSLTSAQIYETFRRAGVNYESGYQGIEEIYIGPDQLLVKLSLPASVFDPKKPLVLHPVFLESALQASRWLLTDIQNGKSWLPVTLEELEIFSECPSPTYVLIHYHDSNREDKTLKLDFLFCDDQGTVCMRMKGLTARVLTEETNLAAIPSRANGPGSKTLIFKTFWKEQPAANLSIAKEMPDYQQHLIMIGGLEDVTPEYISHQIAGVRCFSLQSKYKARDKRYQDFVTQVFGEIQAILCGKPAGRVFIQLILSNQAEFRLSSGLSGLLKTAQLENPKLVWQLIEVESGAKAPEIIAIVNENLQNYCPGEQQIGYQNGRRMVFGWSEVREIPEETLVPWKDYGIYLITGGAGGLGLIFAKEIISKTKGATLVLTGRSPLNQEKQALIGEMEAVGARIRYVQSDIADPKAVKSLIQRIQDEFGGLHGIIHCAGIIKDNFIIKKTREEFLEVLAPKVSGLVNLDETTKDIPLDIFILFSSGAGAMGNIGQADYAAANAYLDAYAKYRNHLAASRQRQGRTLSINWPLWKEGGMRLDAETEKAIMHSTGMAALETQAGIQAMYQALASGQDQVMVIAGNLSKIKGHMPQNASKFQVKPEQDAIRAAVLEQLRERTIHQLKVLFGEVTQLSIDRIDPEEPLETYGIDSIVINQLNQKLAGIFGERELSKTVFYEYRALGALAEYLIIGFPEGSMKWTGMEVQLPEKSAISPGILPLNEGFFPTLTSIKSGRKQIRSMGVTATAIESREPIAIIGISGHYPKAGTLTDYWENLKAGLDCISEIPEERWPLEGFYHPDPQEAATQGKSYSKWGGFVERFADFDPLFFNISPRDAFNMDPQERLFIEVCWEVLEDAGYTREHIAAEYHSRVGVFAGITKTGFNLYGPGLWKQGESIFPYTSFSSVANRVSYLLNFQGPSMPVDTMCSSSLTAIHEACEHLRRGACEMAIAGGVNLYLHPSTYIALCGQQMLSSSGQCKSFGQGGNGFVPGEGAGAVLLKRLSRAITDQDHIYAVIRGSGINHGGKTNGYTVPNPSAQGELIRRVLDTAGVNALAVSYVEAHGAATELGDPIEITGLTQAFGKDTEAAGFCAIGSVKSNIGHLEAAAGIAGLTKIVLQMQHGQLVPSLHAEILNPNIHFEKTPFTVQQTLADWKRPVVDMEGTTREYPRTAGISSFGAGGSNAHLVVEEYIPQERPATAMHPSGPVLIVLSARNEERLQARVTQLLAAIHARQFTDIYLADIAYTLQVGREAMEERLGFIVTTIPELIEKLQGWIEGRENTAGVYRGKVKQNQETLAVFTADEELREAVDKWIERKKYGKLLDLWVKGLVLDWNKLYHHGRPRRISLPAYPFAGERYWIPESYWKTEVQNQSGNISGKSVQTALVTAQMLHPLLQQNTSVLSEQRFSSTFTGGEFFLSDHVINEQRVLPEVACLEMARAAVEQAVGALPGEPAGIRLKDIIWDYPVVVGLDPVQVHIGLFPNNHGEIAYEIYSEVQTTDDAGCFIYSQGRAILGSVVETQALDLHSLQLQFTPSKLSAAQYYQLFKEIGMDYRTGLQGIETIYIGQDQVLAKLALPDAVSDTQYQFLLHPSIMESAMQVSAGLIMGSGALKPFRLGKLQELEIYGGCDTTMWAWIRYSGIQAGTIPGKLPNLNIDVCDAQGRIRVRFKEMEIQAIPDAMIAPVGETQQKAIPETTLQTSLETAYKTGVQTQEADELLTFEEVWHEQSLPNAPLIQFKTIVCFLSDPENQQTLVQSLSTLDLPPKVIFISHGGACQRDSSQNYCIDGTDEKSYEKAFQNIREYYGEVDAVFYLWALENPLRINDYSCIVSILKATVTAKLKSKRILCAGQFENGLERCYLESWIGFERSLGLILPEPQVAAIFQKATKQSMVTTIKEWSQKLWAEMQVQKAESVLYQEGKRYVYRIQPTTLPLSGNLPLKPGGTYLITGGGGGLGMLFAEHFARRSGETKSVNLILTGRSPINAEKQSRLKVLEDLGCRVMYLQADVSDPVQMKEGLGRAKERFGSINGIIHVAGIAETKSIFEKEITDFQKVLDPKIKGTLVLDELLGKESLDFICYFSSSSAILGDFGACDYAIANRFLMAYAQYRDQLHRKGRRQGKTFVINWPLWKEGGMGFGNDENTKMYLQSSGQRILETSEGLAVFERILSQNSIQHLLFIGQPSRIRRFLGMIKDPPVPSPLVHSVDSGENRGLARRRRPEMKGWSLEQCLERDLKECIYKLLRIPRDKIEKEKNLADFGFNSIALTQFSILLIKQLGIDRITPALFFKYSSIEKLIQYFLSEHRETIQAVYQEDGSESSSIDTAGPSMIPKGDIAFQRQIRSRERVWRSFPQYAIPVKNIPDVAEPIAIIGMSGRFPGARNIDEMWATLAAGRDAIQEISEERFDWRLYYSDSNEPGKTVSKWCGCIPGVREFEPLFFEISPREAETMDPRQRLLLQESWKALEDAGYGAEQIQTQKIGMFVGAEQGDYQLLSMGGGGITANHNAIMASRLAYFLNLNGPVLAIDTACSSGLVAAHQAVVSLRNKECDTAIVAGVNLTLSPEAFIGMSGAGMLSADGKCFTFDKRANGMVPGEAVAVVVLKRLSQAVADGDPVYAVIKGSGINYDGKTNGITAPSGVAQTNLLKTVYNQYRVNPEEIDYIVTHGTGTKLGDPVEINALVDAFKDYTNKKRFCALTSTKTNFGHSFASSGLVSLISLVQSLRYEIIPASLNCEQENGYIDWQDSPFYVNKSNRSWPKRDEQNQDGAIQRIGAVSAFGMSGTNAHMVVQNYTPEEIQASPIQFPYYLMVLSAKTRDSLLEMANNLIEFLQNGRIEALHLSEISYTLLEGRHHFSHRLAIVIRDREDAINVLKQADSCEKLPNLFQGRVPRDFTGQKAIEQYAQDLLNQSFSLAGNPNKYQEILFALADLYCQGYAVEWKQLFGETKLHRIHLPTYPFVRESYWISKQDEALPPGLMPDRILLNQVMEAFQSRQVLHPLLQQNTSNFSEQRFSPVFTGRESYLVRDNTSGQQVLPGFASLEMARAALESATGSIPPQAFAENQTRILLKNIVWSRPIVVGDQPVQVHIGLYPAENGVVDYEIYSAMDGPGASHESGPLDEEAGITVYNRGSLILISGTDIPTIDLQWLQMQNGQSACSSSEIEQVLQKNGIGGDPAEYRIEWVGAGEDQLLVKLTESPANSENRGREIDPFVIHPGILSTALQAFLASGGSSRNLTLAWPNSLEELVIYQKCPSPVWAFIRRCKDGRAVDQLPNLDLELYDEQGNICLQIKGLEIQEFPAKIFGEPPHRNSPAASSVKEDYELMAFEETWQEEELPTGPAVPDHAPFLPKTVVCLVTHPEIQTLITELAADFKNQTGVETQFIYIAQGTTYQKYSPRMYSIDKTDRRSYEQAFSGIGEDFGEADALLYLWPMEDPDCIPGYSRIIHIIQAIAVTQLKLKRVLLAARYGDGLERCYLESWMGFERSLGLALPNTQFAMAGLDSGEPDCKAVMKNWMPKLWAELLNHKFQSTIYQGEKRYRCRIRPTAIPSPGKSPVRQGGTYLITGGCGGLGLLFAEHFAKNQAVNLILTGRSPLDAQKQSKMKRLEDLGSRVIYVQADVSDPDQMEQGLNQAKERFGNIHGVIHAAGLESSQSIIFKEIDSFQKVIDPKIKGTMVLDQLLAGEAMDFICYFSSSSAILGDFGSCDYAIANRFQMAYAHYRSRRELNCQIPGKTVVINWPLWKDGGMGMNQTASIEMYLKSSGQRYLEASEGLDLFDRMMAQSEFTDPIQALVLVGQPTRIQRFLGLTQDHTVVSSPAAPSPLDSQKPGPGRRPEMKGLSVEQCLEWDLKDQISQLLKISRDKLERNENLANFGFDSISLAEFATILTRHYGIKVTPSLFYGYPTIEKLTRYYLTEHHDTIGKLFREDAAAVPTAVISSPKVFPDEISKKRWTETTRFRAANIIPSVPELIAVIGMSGRFPGAGNVYEFWENIKNGRDCITEIPAERWDWREYYGDPHQDRGKTKSKWGGFIAGIDQFDPLFFEISPREAELMDPKQRLFLEEAWHALEDAGYMGERIRGMSCGVYVGVEESEYAVLLGGNSGINGNQNATLAARIAYALDLKGPNLALTAACSSGLVALHQACQALRQGDCEIALAGGVSLQITPLTHIGMSQVDMISPDGRSYIFDRRANGLVPGEAVAVVLLKPLAKAIADQDQIYGCIKASGVNYNGKSNGITAPNPRSQAELIQNIYHKYQIDPRKIQYVMAHSVGSKLGDPTEIEALTSAFLKFDSAQQYCAIGSVKPLIGHTFAASGIVSLIGMLMAIKHQLIPALHNYESSNEYINFIESPFVIYPKNQIWATKDNQPRLGAISTTGISGTNAHAVVEEYLPPWAGTVQLSSANLPQIVILSARNRDRLQAVIHQMVDFIEARPELSLADIAYTLQVGREAMISRFAIVVNTREELIQGLKQYLESIKKGNEVNTSVPVVNGELNDENSVVRCLLSGKVGESLVQVLIEEKNLQKLAIYWTQGGFVPWESIHQEERVRRISLPVYPFEKRQCWFRSPESKLTELPNQEPDTLLSEERNHVPVKDQIFCIITRILGLTPEDINLDQPMNQYGFDSIILMQLLQQLQTQIDPSMDSAKLQECKTIQNLIDTVKPQFTAKAIAEQPQTKISHAPTWSQYPELIALNSGRGTQKSSNRPVFWFHGLLGGVESYQIIARKSQRPFYGIQARGWMTERAPLHGIEAMAAYYIQIIQSVQPEGPYDFGGFSLGGVIAYEVTRQLQELGQVVHSIVMLDTQISVQLKNQKPKINQKTLMLQAVNMMLSAQNNQEPGKAVPLIHRDEIHSNISEKEYLHQLIALAKTRGLSKTDTQLHASVRQCIKTQESYKTNSYVIVPLLKPEEVACYYFRNQSRSFFGELEPYFLAEAGIELADTTDHCKEWKKYLPDFHGIDVNSTSHISMLSEPDATGPMVEFCKKLYINS